MDKNDMILAFEIVFGRQQRIIEIENPQALTLAEIAGVLQPGWNIRLKAEDTFCFYSKAEDGLLDGHVPISQLPLASEDEIVLLPSAAADRNDQPEI